MAEERDRSLQPQSEPLVVRILEQGVRGARDLAGATGIDRALDAAAEESIVSVAESPALEQALVQLAAEGRLEQLVRSVAANADVEGMTMDAIDSDAADRIWAQILASDKAQALVERVAEAPEVRAAIAQQGVGLIGDIGKQIRRITRPLDGVLERIARALLGRPRREGDTNAAGLATRALAGAIDWLLLVIAFSVTTALLASILTFLLGGGDGELGGFALGVIAVVGFLIGGLLIVGFWALAGQTPGMNFLGIRLDVDGERRIGARCAFKRLLGLGLALIPFGLGYLAMLVTDRRRGLHDAIAGTEVLYVDDRRAPWSGPE